MRKRNIHFFFFFFFFMFTKSLSLSLSHSTGNKTFFAQDLICAVECSGSKKQNNSGMHSGSQLGLDESRIAHMRCWLHWKQMYVCESRSTIAFPASLSFPAVCVCPVCQQTSFSSPSLSPPSTLSRQVSALRLPDCLQRQRLIVCQDLCMCMALVFPPQDMP